jgi:hypothetical protein
MNKYINLLLGFGVAMLVLVSPMGKVYAQETQKSAAADETFRAFAQTGTCLDVFPSSTEARRLGYLTYLVITGAYQFQEGEQIDWGTNDIQTLFMVRFPSRIYSIVWVRNNPEEGNFEVVVGGDYGCTGNIKISNGWEFNFKKNHAN